ncbi:MAG: PEGA domain-containing protein [Methanoregula sp.]|nr:PEGA domain-containing protein [Methanoregula sp.]
MIQPRRYNNYILVILLAALIIVLPASAFTVAIYGTNSGFNPDLHKDSVMVAKSIPGSSGSELDSNVDQFTDPSVDVIVLGGDDSFSLSTAAKIETAVAAGKILVITYPCNHKFDASLPATNGGTTQGGQFLELADPTKVVIKDIFNGLPSQYSLKGTPQDGEQAVAKRSAIPLLNYDTGTPALLYAKYGKGYVIEWTTAPVPTYLAADEADVINYRLITGLLPAEVSAAPTTLPITTVSPNPLVNETVTITPTGTLQQPSGNVTVHSSPSGASILIDGVYSGTTPTTVTSVNPGNHILRLTLSGYYDYEGTIYVLDGQTSNAFGTLPPLNQIGSQNTITAVATPIVITVPVTAEPTQKEGALDNSIVVAIIGVVTAVIGAVATLFTHKTKKE